MRATVSIKNCGICLLGLAVTATVAILVAAPSQRRGNSGVLINNNNPVRFRNIWIRKLSAPAEEGRGTRKPVDVAQRQAGSAPATPTPERGHGEIRTGAGPLVAASENCPRRRVLLDANWRFHRGDVPGSPAVSQGTPVARWRWIAADDDHNAAKMAAPGLDTSGTGWKNAASGDDVFQGRIGFAWFRTKLPEDKGQGRVLHFDCVDDNATVYLNGRRLAHHEGWNDPFDVDLAPAWKAGGPNELAVLVENTAGAGGITAPVRLESGEMGAATGPAARDYDDRGWRVVHLPHDFIVEGAFSPQADAYHGSLPTSTGWYRLSFDVPDDDKGKSLWLDFDGVYRDAKVWLNGHYLGHHASGYTSFRFNVASYVNYGSKNVLAVHVDPRRFEGWWYEGGGIYRHVWLNVADPVHIAPWGTFVSTSETFVGGTVSERKTAVPSEFARLTIKTTIANTTKTDTAVAPLFQVVDAEGRGVASGSFAGPVVVPAGKEVDITAPAVVENPKLWSPETPYLYRLIATLKRDGRQIDTESTPFGIRTIRFDADKGFFLNGKHVEIQGTCNHQDFAGIGIGVPDSLQYWRVRQLKRMGANAWRMSHNPPTPALLDACDKLGMIVMDENRHVGDSEENLGEVVSMVRRDRNHPSVVIWSMCNEEWNTQGTPKGARIFQHMMDAVRQHDTTRPISCAQSDVKTWGKGFSTVEDLQGCNYGDGRDYDRFHAAFPKQPIYGSETASTLTTRGEYADDRRRAFVSSYNMTDGSWKPVAERPWMCGAFPWTGFDYKGEPTPYGWPCINSHFGILDICGFPKDNYYYYCSWWKPQPIVHLMPHWNWPGKEGQDIRVIAFSNAARVELFLNGQSLGSKAMPKYEHLEWRVKYAPGTLTAKGYDVNGQVTASDTVQTTGAPAALRLSTGRSTLAADGEDVAPVKVEVIDDHGRVVPTADNLVTIQVAGAGAVAGVGNGNPSDHDPDQANNRHAFHGLCMVLVRAGIEPGGIEVTVTSPGLKPSRLNLRGAY